MAAKGAMGEAVGLFGLKRMPRRTPVCPEITGLPGLVFPSLNSSRYSLHISSYESLWMFMVFVKFIFIRPVFLLSISVIDGVGD